MKNNHKKQKCLKCPSDYAFKVKYCVNCFSKTSVTKISDFDNIELLTELGQRLRNKEIQQLYSNGQVLQVPKLPGVEINSFDQAIFTLCLSTGKIKKHE